MLASAQTFGFEENCRRLAKRYRGKLSIRYEDIELTICNWSASGCLVETEGLDPRKRLHLVILCEDGDIVIKVHFEVIRTESATKTVDRVALRFIFDNSMDSATLAAHSRNVENDLPSRKESLLKAGRPVYIEEMQRQAEAGESHAAGWGRLVPFILTVLVIFAIGAIILPHIRSQLAMKIGEKERYITLATNRLEAAQIQHKALTGKMANAKQIFEQTSISLTPEQKNLFKLGIEQIEGELALQSVHIQMLESNLKEVKRGNYFYEKEALGPFSTQFQVDSAPFLTQLLSEIADESRLYPKTPEDVFRYQKVARQRYENAVAEFETNKAKLGMLNEFEERYVGLVKRGALPENTLLFLKRDKQTLLIEQERLHATMELLNENWKNTTEGNFTLEVRLFDKFNPSPNPPPSTFDYNFTR